MLRDSREPHTIYAADPFFRRLLWACRITMHSIIVEGAGARADSAAASWVEAAVAMAVGTAVVVALAGLVEPDWRAFRPAQRAWRSPWWPSLDPRGIPTHGNWWSRHKCEPRID